ncbi:MAG: hypothetical protein O2807_00715 [bacterium]|nr:hypothetical protein [bacterium]
MVEPVGGVPPAAQQKISELRDRETAPGSVPAGGEEEIRQAGARAAALLSGLAAVSRPQPPQKPAISEDVEPFLGGKGRGKSVDIVV